MIKGDHTLGNMLHATQINVGKCPVNCSVCIALPVIGMVCINTVTFLSSAPLTISMHTSMLPSVSLTTEFTSSKPTVMPAHN